MKNTKIKRLIITLSCILILGFLVLKALHYGDFKVFLEAAKLVAAGKNPYHDWIFITEGNYALYFYSPLWAVILIPFTYLPGFIPNFIWLLANAFFLYRIWILLKNYVDIQSLSKKRAYWLLVISIVLNLKFILHNFEMIQMTIFILWGALESLRFFRNNNFICGGLLLAFIINIKILPIVLIPYLIYRKEFKGALSTVFFSIVFLFLPCIYFGWSNNLFMLSEWWSVVNPNNAEHLLETDLGAHSLTALIPSLLTKTTGVLPYSRNLLNLDLATTTYILNGVRIGFILFTVYFLGFPPFKKAKSKLRELRELSFIFLLIPLIFPHQQKYEFFLAAPALFYISYFVILNYKSQMMTDNKKRFYTILTLFILSFVLMTLLTNNLFGHAFDQITQHYKTITYGATVLIIILAMCSPKFVEKK